MVEHQLKGPFYNCDEKYFPEHKCKGQKKFMAISKVFPDKEAEISFVEELPQEYDSNPPSNPPKFELLISLHSLTSFFAPQTLKLIDYIKNRKPIILIEIGSTHNCIHHFISQEINCYIYAVNNFQIMISNSGSMKCGGNCENVCLQTGQ